MTTPHPTEPAPTSPDPAQTSRGNPAGTASLVLGIAGLVWQLVFVFVQVWAIQASIADSGPVAASAWTGLLNLVILAVLGITGLVLGLIGLSRRDHPRVAAGVGTGLATASIFGALLGVLYPVAFTLFAG